MKPFYIHFQRPVSKDAHGALKHKPRGFTALIKENPDDARTVLMQVTFCSTRDQFCKKTGRQEADLAKTEAINKRRVPELLNACVGACQGITEPNHYDYVWKYML